MLNYERDMAKGKPGMVFAFDLQKTKALPYLSTSEAYYKRQLSIYNLGIHDCGTGDGFFNFWHEATASRGPAEIASCIWHWLCQNRVQNPLIWGAKSGGLGDGSPPVGSRGETPAGGLGDGVPQKLEHF